MFYTSFNIVLHEFLNLSKTFSDILHLVPVYNSIKPITKEIKENNKSRLILNDIRGNIIVQNLRFQYSADLPIVLKDISFTIREGEYIAFVGASGSGKSTLLRLLLGFENFEKGSIYYEEQDIKSINIQNLRKNIGVVMQNGRLLSESIYRNIVGYNKNLDEYDAWEAAVCAGISKEILEMPMGLHTMISGDGQNISGGQKQRILIARALAKKPKVLFLDEATSSLDNNSQKIISDNLQQLKITRIVIAHRISTIMNVDRIYVLKGGYIVEEGNFKELMNKKAELYALVSNCEI
jgi:ABC-type bacteriocin/lantibiotic exporter with double-glycine peptidase domain